MTQWVVRDSMMEQVFVDTSQLLPAGLQPVMTDAPAMPTGLLADLRALAALG